MSDTATEVAAAPAVAAPQAPAPAAPQGQDQAAPVEQTPSGPLNRSEARAEMRRSRQEATPATDEGAEAVVDQRGRKHDPRDGKYLPGSGEHAVTDGDDENADLATTEPGDEPAETQAASDGEANDDAAEAAKKFRVEVPKDHPLAQQGRDAISVASQQDADQVRALINGTYARRQEVENLQSEKTELQQRYMDLQKRVVEMESRTVAQQQWMQTPEYKAAVQQYHDIKDTVGTDAASRFWKGIQGDLKQIEEREQATRWEQVQAQEAEATGKRFVNQAWQRVERLPEYIRELPQVETWFEEEAQLFDRRAANGEYDHVESWEALQDEFTKRFALRIKSEPKVIEAYHKKHGSAAKPTAKEPVADRQKIEQEAIERYKRELADKRKGAPPNPLGAIPGAADAGARPSTSATASPDPELNQMSPVDRKRHFRQSARQAVRTHIGT